MSVTLDPSAQTEVAILSRFLGNNEARLPAEMARYLIELGFND